MLTFEEARTRLRKILQAKSVSRGDFVLSSGARSTYYIDCRLTTLDPEGAVLGGQVIHTLIAEEAKKRGTNVQAVGGLTMGADPIALATGIHSFRTDPARPLKCFVVRKAPKAHGQTKLIEGNFAKGDLVVAIDDVITTGESTLKAIEAIEKEGGRVAFAAVLVDRQEGGRQRIEERGYSVVAAFTRDELLNPA